MLGEVAPEDHPEAEMLEDPHPSRQSLLVPDPAGRSDHGHEVAGFESGGLQPAPGSRPSRAVTGAVLGNRVQRFRHRSPPP